MQRGHTIALGRVDVSAFTQQRANCIDVFTHRRVRNRGLSC